MSDLNMNIVIGATVNQATQGLNTVSADLAKTAVAAGKMDSSLLTAGKSSNTAAFALQNLGRVAQDAPFGFIAIQNNLNPLLESFQRLKAETGSSGLALKALASTMSGPAGIGIALSVVSSAILLFTNRSHQAKQATDDFAKAQENAYSSVQTQIAKLNSLVEVARSDVATKDQQTRALREINKLIPDNIGLLNDQNIKTAEGEKILRSYTDSLIAASTVEVFSQRIGAIRLQQHDAFNKMLKEQNDAQEAANKLFSVAPQFKDDTLVTRNKAKAALEYLNVLEATNEEIASLAETARNAQFTAVNLIPDPKDVKEKAKKLADYISKAINDVHLAPIPVNFTFTPKIDLSSTGLKVPSIDDFLKKLAENNELKKVAQQMDAIKTITDDVKSAFDSLFSSIAGGTKVFDAIGQALKQLITKLIATVLEAAILSLILNAIFPGVGGFSFAKIFTQLAGIPKFAGGGVVTRPTLAMVGEQGPERITPLNQISNNNGFPGGEVVFQIHGQTLRGILKRADNSAYISQ